jgi:hypothetical protein
MTQDEIIEMAKEAGMDYLQHISPSAFAKVEIFAKLVAAKEREDCALICSVRSHRDDDMGAILARRIRARTGDKND